MRAALLASAACLAAIAAMAAQEPKQKGTEQSLITTGAKDIPQQPAADAPTLEVATYRELKESCR